MKNNIVEILVTVSLIALSVLLLNPFGFWMPDMMVIAMLACTLGLFGLFAGFVLRENMGDERDNQHRAFAGRNAFLAGAAVLTIGILVQGYAHAVDPWLVGTLSVMILVKIGTHRWSDTHL